jgi:serine/threonine protein kinase
MYRHEYDGEEIAIKMLNSFTTHQDQLAFEKVIHNHYTYIASDVRIQKIRVAGVAWQQLKHPHILSFLGVDAKLYPKRMCLISPWMKNGTIMEFLEKRAHRNANVPQLVGPSLNFLKFYIFSMTPQLLEIAEGMEYLHYQDIIHGDLKGVCKAPNLFQYDSKHIFSSQISSLTMKIMLMSRIMD